MKRLKYLLLASILLFGPAAASLAADVKPLVNDAGKIRPVHTGETVPVANGGTASTTATAARTALGVVIGTDVQAYDADLAAIAGVTSAADKVPYFTGSGTATVATFSSAGRALVDDADASAQRTTLGLGTFATQNAPTGSTQCLHADSSGNISGTGSDCGAGGGGSSGGLIGVRVFTATGAGTYTPTVGTNSIVIELVGAGGGGSAIATPGSGNASHGQGGGAGAWLRKRLTADFSGASYSVGAKGTGGAAGANNGTAGGNTTFTNTAGSPTTYTAAGGSLGGRNTAVAPAQLAGVSGGAATNGDVGVSGAPSSTAYATSTAFSVGSKGGDSRYGVGGAAGIVLANSASTAGVAATGYGAGGSGAQGTGVASAAAGGNGADGLIIIWEYN